MVAIRGRAINYIFLVGERCNVLSPRSAIASPCTVTGSWETSVMKDHWFRKAEGEKCEYAGKEDFVRAFKCERAGLQRLALSLTANAETARQCLISAFRECTAGSSVSREWVLRWIRRVIIRNAIRLVRARVGQPLANTDDFADNGLISTVLEVSPEAIAESDPILGLSEVDRLVFVICVLERYSTSDCALLLDRTPREINEARRRVDDQLGQINELKDISQHIAMH